MEISWIEWLGRLGFWLIESSYVPQIAKLYRLKDAEEFVVIFPLLNVVGRVMAITYSFLKRDHVLIMGFALGITLRIILLAEVVFYRARRRAQARLQNEAVSI